LDVGHTTLPLFGQVRTFNLPSDGSADVGARVAGCSVGFRTQIGNSTVLRLGFDLFREVHYLLSHGQPVAVWRDPDPRPAYRVSASLDCRRGRFVDRNSSSSFGFSVHGLPDTRHRLHRYSPASR
jgi:hypothetical protein